MTDLTKLLKEVHNPEVCHIDLHKRTGIGTLQWFLEKDVKTHPIHNRNDLRFFMCGQEGFAAIEADIRAATSSIDLVLWGFDPGMELVRTGTVWPRGQTYGDLLTAKGREGVKVRLLLWYSSNVIGGVAGNAPDIGLLSGMPVPANMLSTVQAPDTRDKKRDEVRTLRAEYCRAWWTAALRGSFANLEIRLRRADPMWIALTAGKYLPGLSQAIEEQLVMRNLATHHQKPILIDYAPEPAQRDKANTCGYVMGLNSVTDYWDTSRHAYNDPQREHSPDGAFWTSPWRNKPYRDYAIRVQGEALYCLNENFAEAWDKAEGYGLAHGASVLSSSLRNQRKSILAKDIPRPPGARCRAQILRTYPDKMDATILKAYTLASSNATNYIYVENQYFQLDEWPKLLKEIRARYRKGMAAAGVKPAQLTPLHLFVVIPQPERHQMVPNTYDTLNQLGHGQNMARYDKQVQAQRKGADEGRIVKASVEVMPANPQAELDTLGIKPLVAMLMSYDAANEGKDIRIKKRDNTAQTAQAEQQAVENKKTARNRGQPNDVNAGDYSTYNITPGRYREIYIHSKLMFVDDVYTTLGSANLNARSMVGDSELNICTEEYAFTRAARKRVWGNLAGDDLDGKSCTREETAVTFKDWSQRMLDNKTNRGKGEPPVKSSFIHPFEDPRDAPLFRLV